MTFEPDTSQTRSRSANHSAVTDTTREKYQYYHYFKDNKEQPVANDGRFTLFTSSIFSNDTNTNFEIKPNCLQFFTFSHVHTHTDTHTSEPK
jgi:hypothetical protein